MQDVAVYENPTYKPPISSFTNLYTLDSTTNLAKKYEFITHQLGGNFYFAPKTPGVSTMVTTQLSNIFGNLIPHDLNASHNSIFATSTIDTSQRNSLYLDIGNRSALAVLRGGRILFYKNLGKISANGKTLNNSINTVVQSIHANPSRTYYLLSQDTLIPLTELNPVDLGAATSSIEVYSAAGGNTIPNPSFNAGPWQPTVGDCNNYDKNPIIGMSLNAQNKSTGTQSLQLDATRHIACTSENIPLQGAGLYFFSFDYQSPNAQNASYYLGFNDASKTAISNSVSIVGPEWHTYTAGVVVPKGATSANLFVYARATDGKTNIINRYDNFKLKKLSFVSSVTVPQSNSFSKIALSLKLGTTTLTYADPSYTFVNLVYDPSFDKGPWQPTVGDCNDYDENPIIGMAIDTKDKSVGKQSLQLEATRHTACTAQGINVQSGGQYLLSFDYQSPNNASASYYVGYNDPQKTSMSEDLPLTDTSWHTFSKMLTVPSGASTLTLYIYAKESDGTTQNIVRYDNFNLTQVPPITSDTYLISSPTTTLKNPISITYDLVNPTKKLVYITGAITPFFLALSESYDPHWQLEMNNSNVQGPLNSWWPFAKPNKVSDTYHYKLDDFLNAWYVDPATLCASPNASCIKNPDGSYNIEMEIEFWPQRWFYLGLLISGATLVGCLGYLGYAVVERKRKRKQHAK